MPVSIQLSKILVLRFEKLRSKLRISTTFASALYELYRSVLIVVGLGRFELPTSPLSGVRSNQLSYRPSVSMLPAVRLCWWS